LERILDGLSECVLASRGFFRWVASAPGGHQVCAERRNGRPRRGSV
jgi:hypothetical protein